MQKHRSRDDGRTNCVTTLLRDAKASGNGNEKRARSTAGMRPHREVSFVEGFPLNCLRHVARLTCSSLSGRAVVNAGPLAPVLVLSFPWYRSSSRVLFAPVPFVCQTLARLPSVVWLARQAVAGTVLSPLVPLLPLLFLGLAPLLCLLLWCYLLSLPPQYATCGRPPLTPKHERSKVKATTPLCVRGGWLRAGNKLVSLVVFVAVIVRRVGEASNPGPYQYGGASSSHNAAPSAGAARHGEALNSGPYMEGRVSSSSGPPPLEAVPGRSAELRCLGEPAEALAAPKAYDSVAKGVGGFDDADDWAFGIEEEVDQLPGELILEDYAPNPSEVHLLELNYVDTLAEQQALQPSAMAAWEHRPALVEGVVDLPEVVEDLPVAAQQSGFYTREGWWVSAPHEGGSREAVRHRENKMGISGLKGQCSAQTRAHPLYYSKELWKEHLQREALSCFEADEFPTLPPSFTQMPSLDAAQAGVRRTGTPEQERESQSDVVQSRPRRRRGKRRRGAAFAQQTTSIWSFNSSGTPQLRAAVNHCRAGGKDVPVAILCQEHHAGPDKLIDLQAQLKAEGWKIATAHAVQTTAGGWSAGVGVCTPSHVAAGVDAGTKVDQSPASSQGRIASMWLQQVAPGGIQLVSCYLHDVEHGTTRNAELLARALLAAKALGCPWIIGLDAQEEPQDLLKWAAPLVDRAHGTIVHSDDPTHVPGAGTSRRLDYFIIDKAIATAVLRVDTISEFRCSSASADYTVSPSPHKAVKLVLKQGFSPLMVQCLRTPRAFPRARPIGCARAPVLPATGDDATLGGSSCELVSRRYAGIVSAVEKELSGVCDSFDNTQWGRAEGASIATRPVLPRRAAGRRGAMSQKEYVVVWGLNRLKELLTLSHIFAKNGIHSGGQMLQWRSLVRKFCSPSSPVAGASEWDDLVQGMQAYFLTPSDALPLLSRACTAFERVVEAQVEERKKMREISWKQWKSKHCKVGGQGGALYAYIRRTEENPDVITRCLGVRDASPQATLDADFKVWNALWSKLEVRAETPWRTAQEADPGEPLPPLRHPELRAAAATFRVHTASGVDALLPSHFTWLSDELLDRIGMLFETIEQCGRWPNQIATSIVHLIPKAAGGRRPIGLLASLVRLWERARRPTMRSWQASCRRTYNWMARGRGAERSVWAQALYEEAASATGKATASIFLDLVKAFEQVVLGQVWRYGLAHLMPKRVLALALESCTFSRRLSFRGAVSESAQTSTAILAGGGFATDLLFVTLVDAVDAILRCHELSDSRTVLRCFVIVDDIRLQVEGPEEFVDLALPSIARQAVHILEDQLHMQVSRNKGSIVGKTVAQFSSKRLAVEGAKRMSRLGVNVVKKVKNLGIQFTAGSTRPGSNKIASSRYLVGLKKVRRAKKVCKAAQRMAIQSVLTPSFTYGSAAASCPRGLVQQLRTQTAAAFGPCRGRSTTARLLLENADVGQVLVLKSVAAWVSGAWDNLVEQETLAAALRAAQVTSMDAHSRPRGILSGASAYLDALQQIGWSAPSFDSVRTRTGHVLYFGSGPLPTGAFSADPRLVKLSAKDDYEVRAMISSTVARDLADLLGTRGYPSSERTALAAAQSLGLQLDEEAVPVKETEDEMGAADLWRRGKFEHSADGPIPWLWPIRRVLKSLRRQKLWKAAASVRSLVEGGWFTQFRLFSAGLAAHPRCTCGQGVGSLRHKLGFCPLSAERREEYCPESVGKACLKEKWHPLFTRGVPARPKPPPVPQEKVWVEVVREGTVCVASGDVYTDGSAKGSFWSSTRGGWSSVVLDERGRHLWTKRGILGGVNVSSHRAELRAVMETLRVAKPPLRVHIDNQSVLDGLLQDREWCTSSSAADADLWREVWDLLVPLQASGSVDFHKVKAHTGWLELLSRKISPKHQFGNWLADVAAKECARQSEALAPTASFEREVKKATSWTKWVACCAADLVHDTNPLPQTSDARHQLEPGGAAACGQDFGESFMRHEVWSIGGRFTCSRCGLSWRRTLDGPLKLPSRCAGSAAGRAAAGATGNVNFIWSVYAHTRQSLTRKGALLVSADPPPRWAVDPSRLRDIARDEAHLEELLRLLQKKGQAEQGPAIPPWLAAPAWLHSHLQQPWEKDARAALLSVAGCNRTDLGNRPQGHRVAFVGPLAYCTRCACFAHVRLGSRFKGECRLPTGRAASVVASRLQRLRGGKHPIAGTPFHLDEDG